ncbi:MAG: ABC transporter permease [Candidatus Korarchaeum sp.]|nr:ABC transporter permease [Candidatus Korarchaeum sp.]MDW8034987.1 ABC transporter permease [Candidatus Korarchaeum sp.]
MSEKKEKIPLRERLWYKELIFTLRRIKESPLSLMGLSIIIFFIIIAVLAPVIAPPKPGRDPFEIPRFGYVPTPSPPSPEHPFGLTEGQYDLFYGCIWGTITAFRVGFLGVVGALVIGILLGAAAGYFGGLVDEILMRVVDIVYAIPGLILAMAFVIALGQSLDNVIIALMLVGWPTYARLTRAGVLQIKGEDYVEAARAMGCSHYRILFRHILPNSIFAVFIVATLDMGSMVLTASALSFLGLGAPLGYADWGQLVSLSRNWLLGVPGDPFAYWYTYTYPGIFLFAFVLGWNLLGDAFRDILDPTLRRR